MKKQICFAGFGEVELAAFEAFFESLGEAWDCVFSPDAASALTALAATRFDAVVANLVPSGIKLATTASNRVAPSAVSAETRRAKRRSPTLRPETRKRP